MFGRTDCIHFIGDKPCKFESICNSACKNFEPIGEKILIIKLGALGDVLRTTPIIYGIKDKFKNPYITWVTSTEAKEILQDNPFINNIVDVSSFLPLLVEEFSSCYNLDKAKEACALATLVKAENKYGYGLNKYGNIFPFNKGAEYSFRLGLDNNLKFRKNKLSYQEIIFMDAELKLNKDNIPPYIFNIKESTLNEAKDIFYSAFKNLNKSPTVGINLGGGSVLYTKRWDRNHYIKLAEDLIKEGLNVVIFGGIKEKDLIEEIKDKVETVKFLGYYDIKLFGALISLCDAFISVDTLGLHLALAMNVPCLAIFGSTAHQEVYLYNKGKKIIPENFPCSPCYKVYCDKGDTPVCMTSITPQKVKEELIKLLQRCK